MLASDVPPWRWCDAVHPTGGGTDRQVDRPTGGGTDRRVDRPTGGGTDRQVDRPASQDDSGVCHRG